MLHYPVKILMCSNNGWHSAFVGKIIYVKADSQGDFAREDKTKRLIPLNDISEDLTGTNCFGLGWIHDLETDEYLNCKDCRCLGYFDNN